MPRSLCLFVGLVLLASRPALPDVIDVTVDGSVSGSGGFLVGCAPSTPGCTFYQGGGYFLNIPYSFSGANTQLGSFHVSGSTDSSGFPATMEGYADQDTVASTTPTGDALNITLLGGYSESNAPFYNGSESSN